MLTNSPKEYGHDWAYYVKSQTIKLNCSLLHKTIKIIKLKCPLPSSTSILQLTATLLHLLDLYICILFLLPFRFLIWSLWWCRPKYNRLGFQLESHQRTTGCAVTDGFSDDFTHVTHLHGKSHKLWKTTNSLENLEVIYCNSFNPVFIFMKPWEKYKT
jgi:hypothetical protein